MPATDLVCGYFNAAQWTDDDLRLAASTLQFLATKAAFADEDKEFIARLIESLEERHKGSNVTD